MQRRPLRLSVLMAVLALTMLLMTACNGDSDDADPTSTGADQSATHPAATDTDSADMPTEPAAAATSDDSTTAEATDASGASTIANTATESTGQSDDSTVPVLEGYVDNRSGPVDVLQSLYSAVNLKEYARAYAYWEPSDDLAEFPDFAEGYADTESVELTTGEVTGDAGAGQLYFSVPVTLDVTNTDGSQQTFAGCYTLHLARPEIQTEPPFQPMSIASANISEVEAGADPAEVMATSCQ